MKALCAVVTCLVLVGVCQNCSAQCGVQRQVDQVQLQRDLQPSLVAPSPPAAGVIQRASDDQGRVSNGVVSNRVSNRVSNQVSNRVSNRVSNGVSNRAVSNRVSNGAVSNGSRQIQQRGLINVVRF